MNRRRFFRFLGVGTGVAGAAPFIPWSKFLAPIAPVRKLKCVWSEEAAQNLQYMYNLRADEALMAAMTKEIQDEIDSDILKTMKGIVG